MTCLSPLIILLYHVRRKTVLFSIAYPVANLTDTDGIVIKTYKYDAFGVEKNIDYADTNAFRYCGEYYDKETATIYLRARYYNPNNGRFTQRDSFAGKQGDPLSLNLYTYCHNNPICYIDPSGHNVFKKWWNFWEGVGEYQYDISQGEKDNIFDISYKFGSSLYDVVNPKKVSDSVMNPTSLISQEEDNWCWNASSQMFSENYGFSSRSQQETAEHVFDREDDLNHGGTTTDMKSAISFYSDNSFNTTVKNVLKEKKLLKTLTTRGPVIITRGWYDNEGNRNGGHATIIYGYKFNEDTNAYDYYINDPWEPNIGSSYTRQYEEIVDGSSTGIDSGRWEESVYASWYN